MKRIVLLLLSGIILCIASVAHTAEKELPVFTSIRDALDSTEGYAEIRERNNYIVLILDMDGRYIRMVVLLDDRAKDLYRAAEAEEFSTSAMEAFNEYAWTLPLSNTGELTETPKSQAELDTLKGKTVQELMDEGFGKEMILSESELEAPVAVNLEYGLYKYEFEVTDAASGDPCIMTIKCGKYNGFSRAAFDIDSRENLSDPQ